MSRPLPVAYPIQFSMYAQQVALGEIVRRARQESKSIDDYRFRVGVAAGGCNGFSYYVKVDNQLAEKDYLFEIGDLSVVVDQLSMLYLKATYIDYIDTAMEKKFTFTNPNAKGSCGCGLSVDF